MALRFIGIDPSTDGGNCPTVWLDDQAPARLVVQGWKSTDSGVVRLPARMSEILRKACGAADRASVSACGSSAPAGAVTEVWYDSGRAEFLFRGQLADADVKAACRETGPIPDHEDVVCLPADDAVHVRRACDDADRADVR